MGLTDNIKTTYRQASSEVKKKMDSFWAAHKVKAEQKKKDLDAGKITEKQYRDWLQGQVFTGKRWQEKLDDITQTYVGADEKARQIIGGTTKNVFVNFANSTARDIEKKVGGGVSFDLYDKHTVERLLQENPKLLPEWKINKPKDYRWNHERVQNSVMQGIIQGESIPDIAKRLTGELSASNARHMVLFARTAITGAQNAGRMDMLHQAQDMGIVVKKKWLAAHDDRVRDAHAELDGQVVDVDEPFHSELGDIMYPGDPNADPANVYNCRCTLVYVYEKRQEEENTKTSFEGGESSGSEQGNDGAIALQNTRFIHYEALEEYKRANTPGVGTLSREKGEKQHNKIHEIETAQALIEQLGGDVVLLDNSGRQSMRDCIWNGETWEIKKATTAHAAGKRTEVGLGQIAQTGGNLIIDCWDDDYETSERNVISKLNALAVPPLDVIIMHKGKVKRIIRLRAKK